MGAASAVAANRVLSYRGGRPNLPARVRSEWGAAAAAMVWGIVVLRSFDLHIPPALAIALLPLVMDHPTIFYPFSVAIGTGLLTVWFLNYARLFDAIARGASRASGIAGAN
jgi:hypothetical protein